MSLISMNYQCFFFIFCFCLFSCSDDDPILDPVITDDLYFPPISSPFWETTAPDELSWDANKITDLNVFLEESNTRAFIVLKDGKIVIEEYFGKNIIGQEFTNNDTWYWASAGKSLIGFLTGIAQEDGLLNIEDPSSDYLGEGWSAMTQAQEEAVTIRHHLTMTTGLDDRSIDVDCTEPSCLNFFKDPGTRWAYHNGPYTLTHSILAGASGQSFDNYFNSTLRDPIGMDGSWIYLGSNHVYWSTPRAMARFGLLILNKGKWQEHEVLSDQSYFIDMVNSSQSLNKSYGYLWWLNGKSSHMLPGLQLVIPKMLTPNAPSDMFAAAGKNGQLLNIVPSKGVVVVRMGDNPDNSLVPTNYQNELWEHLNAIGL